MRRLRSFFKSILLLAAVTAISMLAAEAVIRFALFSKEERSKGAEVLWRSHRNLYTTENSDGSSICSLSDTIVPNPYLQFNLHEPGGCGRFQVNNIGMPDRRDFPQERDPNFYSVVVVGASVASHIADARWLPQEANWLELSLNKSYISPNGKPFRVYSGATGGWNYPNQITFLSLFGERVDAVVALDGYNEVDKAANFLPIYFPDPLAYSAAIRSLRYPVSTLSILLTGSFRRAALSNPVTRSSFLFYTTFLGAVNYLSSHIALLNEEHAEGIDKSFVFSGKWRGERSYAENTKLFTSYIRLLAATAGALNLRYAHFVQPNRLIGKELTEEEKQYKQTNTPELYWRIAIQPSLDLAAKGINTASLHEVFKNEKGTIYGDFVHCKFDAFAYSPGYKLMADAMADKIAGFWKLKKKGH